MPLTFIYKAYGVTNVYNRAIFL